MRRIRPEDRRGEEGEGGKKREGGWGKREQALAKAGAFWEKGTQEQRPPGPCPRQGQNGQKVGGRQRPAGSRRAMSTVH